MPNSDYESKLVALLANDELGLSDWKAEIDEILMEKWANRFDMRSIPAEREQFLELVWKVSEMGFIPLSDFWQEFFTTTDGLPPVVWSVGATEGKRLVRFKMKKDYLKENTTDKDIAALLDPLITPLDPWQASITLGDELIVTLIWKD